MSTNKFSADEIFRVIALAKKPDLVDPHLTQEQQNAVEGAPTDGPALVIAGAGSGKTELMAIRVLWLVANGHAEPQEILGLTFTRKAASELAARINDGLKVLARSEYWPDSLRGKALSYPAISTYNAFANSIFQDNALMLGFEPDSTLLTDASRYQLAREVLIKYAEVVDARIAEDDRGLDTLVGAVLGLASHMVDHQVSAEQVKQYSRELFDGIVALPKPKAARSNPENPIYKSLYDLVERVLGIEMFVDLAERFMQEKRARGLLDYSDQVALAVRAVETNEHVAKLQKALYKHVLLDEYQDTSTLQTRLLTGLFAKHSVIAVGDPNQSIYGWRGASASNLREYLAQFGSEQQPVKQFPLPKSWRNPVSVLKLANELIVPLLSEPEYQLRGKTDEEIEQLKAARITVVDLEARDDAPEGDINIEFLETQSQEAARVADWFKSNLKPETTGAMLVRAKSMVPKFVSALIEAKVPYQVIGLDGLLQMPEIIDLVSALKVINDPNAGSALLRLLAGPRWRMGAKDLDGLYQYARKLSKFHNEEDADVLGEDVGASIIDALDQMFVHKKTVKGISELGHVRLYDAARLFQRLRSRLGLPLVELVRVVEQELWLDIELTANPNNLNPMQNLNAFASIVASYAGGYHASLSGFLNWLKYAEEKEKLEQPAVAEAKGVVQILTIHAAKGLEWDLVAIPSMNANTFPSKKSGNTAWLDGEQMPYALRADGESLPQLNLAGLVTQGEVKEAIDSYKKNDVLEYRMREERRLVYVAITRTKRSLLVTASQYKAGAKEPLKPSVFMFELAASRGVELQSFEERDENPDEAANRTMEWPMEPLGPSHRPKVAAAAEAVEAAIDEPDESMFDEDIDLLIKDRDEAIHRAKQAKLPVRISASRFKEFILETAEVAEGYRRPVPREPFSATMAGTLFHTWVEERFGVFAERDELDGLPENEDESNPKLSIEELKATFEASRFAKMTPADIECEIQVTIASNTFICKIDAVFETEGGYEIVDWKTGVPPKDDKEEAERALQLALYRMAYAKIRGVDPEKIGVCLYYVQDNREIKPKHVLSESELLKLWESVLEKVTD